MFGHKIDILNLEWPWPYSDRDRNIMTPVYLYLREKYKLNIKSENIFNGYYYLLKYRPKLLLLSNSIGADVNFLLSKAAYKSDIKVVSLISEGIVSNEKYAEEFLWGWNKERILYEDAKILWSRKSKNFFENKYPELKDKLFFSGGTGFDRYKLLRFMDKKDFLIKNNLQQYKKIIGIASWGFDQLFEDSVTWEKNKGFFIGIFGQKQIEMHRRDLFLLQDIYKNLIENNKDILFILRVHPAVLDRKKTEFFGLENYENVYVSNPAIKYKKDYINDLINVSDLWIGYNSTTALEAWLLGKTTFLVNPTKSDFTREDIYKGSPIASNFGEAQRFIEDFFSKGRIDEFEILENIRKEIVEDTIGYDDGKNHIRAAEIVYKIFSENNRAKGINYFRFPFLKMLRQCFGFYRVKHFMKDFYVNADTASEIEYYENLYLKPIKNEISENGK